MDFGDYTNESDNLIDNYFCSYLGKFFDEITQDDLIKCPILSECEKCKYYGTVEQLDRMIKIKDGEVILLSIRE